MRFVSFVSSFFIILLLLLLISKLLFFSFLFRFCLSLCFCFLLCLSFLNCCFRFPIISIISVIEVEDLSSDFTLGYLFMEWSLFFGIDEPSLLQWVFSRLNGSSSFNNWVASIIFPIIVVSQMVIWRFNECFQLFWTVSIWELLSSNFFCKFETFKGIDNTFIICVFSWLHFWQFNFKLLFSLEIW